MQETKAKAFRVGYNLILKPMFFQFDPELMHNLFIGIGKILGRYKLTKKITNLLFNYQNKILEQELFGIKFKNPIGLSAGFDKNAELVSIMEDVGFGFVEVGSITALSCKGNTGKRMKRIIDKKSIWVNMGLNNKGAKEIFSRISKNRYRIPYGVSIAKTNCKETAEDEVGINDYVSGIKESLKYNSGSYITINISCPNAYGGQPFHRPELLDKLMRKVQELKIKKPIFIKISPDLTKDNVDKIIKISKKYKISGFVCTNLTKKHKIGKGGLSGKIIQGMSDELISYVYKDTRNWTKKPIIIGVGGIFTAEDAYRKIKLGASLLQMITGMIYEGPQVIGEINQGLVRLLKNYGYKNISEAVGKGLN